jgi:hypothetical protein
MQIDLRVCGAEGCHYTNHAEHESSASDVLTPMATADHPGPI